MGLRHTVQVGEDPLDALTRRSFSEN